MHYERQTEIEAEALARARADATQRGWVIYPAHCGWVVAPWPAPLGDRPGARTIATRRVIIHAARDAAGDVVATVDYSDRTYQIRDAAGRLVDGRAALPEAIRRCDAYAAVLIEQRDAAERDLTPEPFDPMTGPMGGGA